MTICDLKEYVIKAGDRAFSLQSGAVRGFKSDGTVVTRSDIEISDFLSGKIRELFPDSNIISEEAENSYDAGKKYSFIIDPIDGTDAYSMGMPCWCVSLGVLEDLQPAGAIIYAPSWGPKGGTFIFLDIDGKTEVNGKTVEKRDDPLSAVPQIMVPSNVHRNFDLSSFPGKVRNTGSSVINITAMLFHSQISGAVINRCYVWDIAAAHAAVKKCGLDLEFFSGEKIDYSDMISGKKSKDFMICGHPSSFEIIRENFIKK